MSSSPQVLDPPVPSSPQAHGRAADERVNKVTSIPFILVHFVPLLAIFTGVSLRAVLLGVVLYFGRMFCITAGYHRYFAHRSYRLNRFWQFVLAFGGATAAQKGPLWWAAHHRDHHRNSDNPSDIHSPTQKGFWWSHVGWILCDKYAATQYGRIRDFAKFPELVFLNKRDWIAPWSLGVASYLIAGWSGLVVGFFLSTVLLWHATFTVNSLAHVLGRRRYATTDTSRNSVAIALLTLGEGWHNNHHYYQASARQGFFWWELDPTFYLLKVGGWLGMVKDMRTPPARVRAANRISAGSFDVGMFKAYWAKASVAVARSHVSQVVHEGRLTASDALASTRDAATQGLAERKLALEGFVHSSLESAEELARLSRLGQRELGMES